MMNEKGGFMRSYKDAMVVLALVMGLVAGCSTGSVDKAEGDALVKKAQASRQEWNKVDPQFEAFAKKGYGWAFFPEITKGGFVVGGARGQGVVYRERPTHRLCGLDSDVGGVSGRASGLQPADRVREPAGDGKIQTQ